jgi:GNAT superfamily N-acetyltransferase
MNDPSILDNLVVHAVDKTRWQDFESLIEGKGAPKYCWCMTWRETPQEARHPDNARRKAAMAMRVQTGIPVGLLGYLDGKPVAWCSIAPRSNYRRLTKGQDTDEGVWSIVCFFILRSLRGQGITHLMIAAAVEYARSKGAKVVEAYPVEPDSPSYRFMGYISAFKAAGFHEVGRVGTRRFIYQLELS